MSALVQQRYFGFASSSTWVLLLLSVYFSWICPAEANVASLPDLGWVATQRISEAAVYPLADFKKTATLAVAHLPSLLPFTALVTQALVQQKQREALLPASSVVVQLKSHRPRGAFAVC